MPMQWLCEQCSVCVIGQVQDTVTWPPPLCSTLPPPPLTICCYHCCNFSPAASSAIQRRNLPQLHRFSCDSISSQPRQPRIILHSAHKLGTCQPGQLFQKLKFCLLTYVLQLILYWVLNWIYIGCIWLFHLVSWTIFLQIENIESTFLFIHIVST